MRSKEFIAWFFNFNSKLLFEMTNIRFENFFSLSFLVWKILPCQDLFFSREMFNFILFRRISSIQTNFSCLLSGKIFIIFGLKSIECDSKYREETRFEKLSFSKTLADGFFQRRKVFVTFWKIFSYIMMKKQRVN